MYAIDINCDVGEGLNNEIYLMPHISSCSIACGAHAGDKYTIENVVKLAIKHHVKIGAHPSFPDKENFGRKKIDIPLDQLQLSLEKQIQLIIYSINNENIKLNHVKPHGALYNLVAVDKEYALTVVKAVKNIAKDAYLYVPYKSVIQKTALENGLKVKIEAFADRNYNSDLTLVSRKLNTAMITDKEKLVKHLLKMILQKKVKTVDGVEVELIAETFCFHGDNPNAIKLLKYASKMLQKNGINIV